MTDIEIRTRSRYDALSPAEQKVARYFLQNLSSVFDDPIASLAEKSGVSQVVWVRFCKSLGFHLQLIFSSLLIHSLKRRMSAGEASPFSTLNSMRSTCPASSCVSFLLSMFKRLPFKAH